MIINTTSTVIIKMITATDIITILFIQIRIHFYFYSNVKKSIK